MKKSTFLSVLMFLISTVYLPSFASDYTKTVVQETKWEFIQNMYAMSWTSDMIIFYVKNTNTKYESFYFVKWGVKSKEYKWFTANISHYLSPDQKKHVFVFRWNDDQVYIYDNGQILWSYDPHFFDFWSITISPDGKNLAFNTLPTNSKPISITLNGKNIKVPTWSDIIRNMWFDKDNQLYYISSWKEYTLVNLSKGSVISRYPSIKELKNAEADIIRLGGSIYQKWTEWYEEKTINTKKNTEYDTIIKNFKISGTAYKAVQSIDGKHFAYSYWDRSWWKYTLVIDGNTIEKNSDCTVWSFSWDNRKFFYICSVMDNKGLMVLWTKLISVTFDSIKNQTIKKSSWVPKKVISKKNEIINKQIQISLDPFVNTLDWSGNYIAPKRP